MSAAPKREGGLKGFFTRAHSSFSSLLSSSSSYGFAGARMLGKTGFFAATTLIVVFLPLIMEISREPQVIELEKLQVKELKSQGVLDHQLQQMGLGDTLHAPKVLG